VLHVCHTSQTGFRLPSHRAAAIVQPRLTAIGRRYAKALAQKNGPLEKSVLIATHMMSRTSSIVSTHVKIFPENSVGWRVRETNSD